MFRNENKLERARKKEEEIDKRLQEAGLYDDGLAPEMKHEMLKILEESRETARLEEEERQNLQRREQNILAETLCKSSTHKESCDSSSSSSRHRKEAVDVEEAVLVSTSPARLTRQEAKSVPSASRGSNVVLPSGSRRRSVIKSSRDHVARLHTQVDHEDEDLILLDDPECQVIKTTTENSPSVAVESPQPGRRKCIKSVKDTNTPPANQPCPSPMSVSPVLGKSRIRFTNSITSTTVIASDDSEPETVPQSHESPEVHHKGIPNPHVVLFPLNQTVSQRKNVVLSHRKDLTSVRSATPARKKQAFSHRDNASSQNSTLAESSPSLQKNLNLSPRNPFNSSGNTTSISPDLVSSSNLPPSGTFTPSKDSGTHSSSKKSGTPNFSKDSAAPSIRRNLATSVVKDSSLSRNCSSSVSPPSGASITTSTSSTISTTTAATTLTHALVTPRNTAITTSDKEVGEPVSPSDASPESDLDDKITLRTGVLRSINVFSRRQGREVILRRKLPLPSEAPDKAFHRGTNESPQQCRSRILSLMGNMALHLQQHQSTLPALAWSSPLTVNWRLKHSLDRPRPASRQILQRQQLEEEMKREESKQRHTRQAARCSREALKPLPGPSTAEDTTRVRRQGHGRTLGLRKGKRPALTPLPKVTSDSDTDLEIGPASPSLPSASQSSPLPCPPKARGTVLVHKINAESQPQQHRRTFILESDSEGSDNECFVKANVARKDNHASSCASPSDPLSDLCGIEDEQPHAKPARPAISRLARQGIRRPAPEPTGSTPIKLRKTHTPNRENFTTGSIPEETNQLLPDSSDFTPAFEGASEWNNECRQNQQEEQEEEEEEEKMPCPICQRLFSLHEIEVHASDCLETKDSPQHQQTLSHSPRRQRARNEESAVVAVSSKDKSKEGNEKYSCNLCKETFSNSEALHRHIQSCHKMEEEEEEAISSLPSSSSSSLSAIRQTHKRKLKVLGQTLNQEVIRGRGELSQPGRLANVEGKHSSLQP